MSLYKQNTGIAWESFIYLFFLSRLSGSHLHVLWKIESCMRCQLGTTKNIDCQMSMLVAQWSQVVFPKQARKFGLKKAFKIT